MKLTPKQQTFADAVLGGATGSAAARAAGCSEKSCGRSAGKWLAMPHVNAYIEQRRAALAVRAEWSRAEMLASLRTIAEPTAGVVVSEADRIRAIAQASRMLGYDAPQKHEVAAGGVMELFAEIRAARQPQP